MTTTEPTLPKFNAEHWRAKTPEACEEAFQAYLRAKAESDQRRRESGSVPWHGWDEDERRALFMRRYR
ncbi:hypothetical protein [Mycobacteroides abscessus]|uniref:hypothetical protein n=1 Tax=Mycobacteroides abscessus TaxID=36809 RepID=UPI0010561701|nr:hypothetical protein [Mycobacteroides abscessus]